MRPVYSKVEGLFGGGKTSYLALNHRKGVLRRYVRKKQKKDRLKIVIEDSDL